MKRFVKGSLKVVGVIILWGIITAILPPVGFIILLIGLPVWSIMKSIKKDNPHLSPKANRRVTKTIILSISEQAKVGSAIGRAVVGDFVAGEIGAIVGAMTGKKKTTTRFLVFYDDGSQEAVDVPDGSLLYREYINNLDIK